jgi:group I intron endonuclease
MISGIYKITNKITNNIYVGSAVNFKKRWSRHLKDLIALKHPNSHLQSSFNIHGEHNFMFEIIEYCEPIREILLLREQFYLDTIIDWDKDYNKCKIAGSSIGIKRTDEFKKKISKANLGKKDSKETIEKRKNSIVEGGGWANQVAGMIKANTGAKRDKSVGIRIAEKLSKPVIQLTKDGVFIKEFPSAIEAQRQTNIANSSINRVCSGKRDKKGIGKTAGGFVWKYKKDYYSLTK